MKNIYITPRIKHCAMFTKDAFTAIIGSTDNSSILQIGYGGGNEDAPTPSANKSLWDDPEEY